MSKTDWNNQDVVVSLAMMRVGDAVAELAELSVSLSTQIAELSKTLADWADVLAAPTNLKEE